MMASNENYLPNHKSRMILYKAWEHVNSVPYKVSARWLFYRLLQDGCYHSKKDYQKYLQLLSRVRHAEWGSWRRDTIVDDTRQVYGYQQGHPTPDHWAAALKQYGVACSLDHWYKQDFYVEVWFEAAAMMTQFKHYTRDIPITLRPFQGMYPIYQKDRAAQELAAAADKYNVPVVVLYFGDYDQAGCQILDSTIRDVRNWCPVEIDLWRVGLNEGDGQRYGIPEDFDHPGNYQWEALNDDTAGSMITEALNRYIDFNVINETSSTETAAEKAFRDFIQGFTFAA